MALPIHRNQQRADFHLPQRDDRCRLPPLQSCIVSVREYQLHKNAPRPVS